jgi:copper chaperone
MNQGEMQMVRFRVEDMTCGHCASKIARAVAAVDADAKVEVSLAQKLVRITSSAAEAELAEAIAEAGYAAEPVAEAAAAPARAAGGCCCGSRAAVPAPALAAAGSCCGS